MIKYEEMSRDELIRELGETRKKLEEARADYREVYDFASRYHIIYENSPIAIEFYDPAGLLIDVNSACLNLFGIKDIQSIKNFSLFDDPNINNDYKEKLKNGETVQYEGPFDFEKVKSKNLYPTIREEIIWLKAVITPIKNSLDNITGFLIQIEDITARKHIKEELIRSEEKYRHLSENMPAYISTFLSDGTLTYVNEHLAKMTGLTREELTGKNFFDMLTPEDVFMVKEKLKNLTPENPYETHEQIHIDKEGKKYFQQWTNLAFFDARGVPVSFQATGTDITEHKITEKALYEKTDNLTERVKELNCIYNLSHLIETPNITLEEILRGSLPFIKSAWKYPDIACVKIRLYDSIYMTENYKDTEWKLSDQIVISGRIVGEIDVSYLEERLADYKGPFLKEEVELLRAVVERFQRVIERIRTEKHLKEINNCLLNLTPDYDINVRNITELCGKELGADCAIYNILKGNILCSVGKWNTPPDYQSEDRPDGHICYDVIKQGKKTPVIIRNLPQTSYNLTDKNVGTYGLKTYMGQSVLCGGISVGSLCVVYTSDIELTEEKRSILGILTSALGREEEKKLVNEALKISEKRYRNLFEANRDGLVVIDGRGYFLDTNKAYCDMVGYSKEELIDKKEIKSITTEKSYKWEIEEIWNKKLLKQGYSGIYEKEFIRKEGTVFPVESQAFMTLDKDKKPEYIWLSFRDITERKRAEKELKSAYEKLDALWNVASVADADIKKISDHILGSIAKITGSEYGFYGFINKNESVMTIHSWSGEAMKDCSMVDKPCDFIINEAGLWGEAIRSREPLIVNDYSVEHRGKKGLPKGHVRLTNLMVVPFFSHGRITSVVAVANRDIPYNQNDVAYITSFLTSIQAIIEWRESEEEQKKLRSQLLQAQKMEAVGTLAGGIAHDFNNILAAIIGYTELSLDLTEDDLLKSNLYRVLNSGKRAKDLVRQILTFSRKVKHEVKPVIIGTIIEEAVKLLRASLPTTIDIIYSGRDKSIILADPTQIHQIIMNLGTNAFHAMKEKGGILKINLENILLEKEEISLYSDLKPGYYVRLTVGDTGKGILPEHIGKIFEPYFTTKELDEGTGLGLSVVHGIVKSYGGDIKVYSEVGKGTKFQLIFPRIETEVNFSDKDISPLRGGMERILIVDDEEAIVEFLKKTLEILGYKITDRKSSFDALNTFREDPDRFDLVITDLTMPNMTGKELAAELHKIKPDLPVILCTGNEENIIQKKYEWSDISDYIIKPFTRGTIASMTRSVLDKRLNTGQSPV